MLRRFQANCLIAFGCVTGTAIVSWAAVTHRLSPHGDGFEFLLAAAAIVFVSCLNGLRGANAGINEMLSRAAEFFQFLMVSAAIVGLFLSGAFLALVIVAFITTRW